MVNATHQQGGLHLTATMQSDTISDPAGRLNTSYAYKSNTCYDLIACVRARACVRAC